MYVMKAAALLLVTLTACPPAPRAEDPVVEPTASVAAGPSDVASAAPPASASAAATATATSTSTEPAEMQTHTLDAKVKSITPFGQKAGDVYVVDADARFVIELELMGVAPAMADDPPGSALTAGKTVAFGVHSPTKLFKSDANMVGKRMHFSVTRTRKKNTVEIGALQVE
jgi:hypothetical protein